MNAKYISASLVTVTRIFGLPIPLCVDLISCACTTTSTKTATSEGTVGRVNSGSWGIKKSDEIPTKGKTEGHLNGCEALSSCGKTHAIRVQREPREICH